MKIINASVKNQLDSSSVAVSPSTPKNKKSTAQESKHAAAKLLQANVLPSLKSEKGPNEDADDPVVVSKRQLRISIPLSMSLVDRLLAMPVLPMIQRSVMHMNRNFDEYELSCKNDLGIWHASDDALAILNNYPFHSAHARVELPYFVLWGLHAVLPAVYQVLSGSDFGPAREPVVMASKALPVPIPYDTSEPCFEFKHGLVLGQSQIHPTKLVHTFITGATGVGKTFGGVKPLLQSFLAYRNADHKAMSMLVIDPKGELLSVCSDALHQDGQPERLFRLGAGKKLALFTPDCVLGLEDRYRSLLGMVQLKTQGESSVWQEKGNRLNIEMAELDRRFQLQTGYLLWGVVRSLLEGEDHTRASQWSNIHAVLKHAVISRANVEWLAATSTVLLELCPGLHGLKSLFTPFLSDSELLNQLFYRVSNSAQVCLDLSASEVVGTLNTDLYANEHSDDVSIDALLTQGKVLLYQPTPTHFGDITGRLVKSRFFSGVLSRGDMTLPIGYIADEFQRFITADRDTGEQSFLDRCRAYRVNCVLASQSLTSIEHALTQNGESSPRLAVDIIVANTATKIVYRSIDTSTHRSLKEWIPPALAGRPHVVDIRPPAQLAVGNAYYLCDAAWGMYRYEKRALPAFKDNG